MSYIHYDAPATLTLLHLESGDTRGRVHVLRGETLVGRAPGAHLRVDHASVAKRHCRLRLEGGSLVLEDLESPGGVFVNGEAVRRGEPRPLVDGDRIALGASVIAVVGLPASGGAALASFRDLFATLKALPDDARDEETLYQVEKYLALHCYVLAVELDAFDALVAQFGGRLARRAAERVKKRFRSLFDGEALIAASAVAGRWEVDTLFADDRAALEVAEALRATIAETPLGLPEASARVTASIGVSCEREFPVTNHLSPFRSSQDAARERMRRAQRLGGDRVCAME